MWKPSISKEKIKLLLPVVIGSLLSVTAIIWMFGINWQIACLFVLYEFGKNISKNILK